MDEATKDEGWLATLLRQPILYGSVVLVAIFFLGNWMVSQRKAQAAGVTWETDLAHAKVEASTTNKPIFVEFGATWCGACREMQNEVFTDPRVDGILRQMICVHIDVDSDPDDTAAYNVHGIPRMFVFDPNLNTRMDITGGMYAGAFAQQLKNATGLSPYGSAKAFAH